jgi:succinate dehydrogenase / fumarate reductase, cytochrome b subunit
MTAAMTLYGSSIGKKAIMAVTGLVMIGFLVFHMYGNLKIFGGPQMLNEYAAGLREIGHPIFGHEHLLWIARLVLLASVVLHITAAVQLTAQSRASTGGTLAGTGRYHHQQFNRASFASRTIRWGGIIIFLFILYHLLHFTFGVVGYNAARPYVGEQAGAYQVYNNVIYGFQFWPAALVYILAMAAVALHVYHGTWSMMQTLGLNNGSYSKLWSALAVLLGVLLFVGNITIPLAVLTGFLQPV